MNSIKENVLASEQNGSIGKVTSLWRYPVKSMMGEQLMDAYFTSRGMLGDRAYALIDRATGKVASAKNPRKWPTLFSFVASYSKPPEPSAAIPRWSSRCLTAATFPVTLLRFPVSLRERSIARWRWPAARRKNPAWRSTGPTWTAWRIGTR